MAGALMQLRRDGMRPLTVVDVSAARDEWSLTCRRWCPESRYILIEPPMECREHLESGLELLGPRSVYVALAAGEGSAELVINVHIDLVGSSLLKEREPTVNRAPPAVSVSTVDSIARKVAAHGPFLLKVDVQGAELRVMEGAAATLAEAACVIVEVSVLEFFEGRAVADEIIAFMKSRGFAIYDVVDHLYRPLDGALAQIDLFFVPVASPPRVRHEFATETQRAVQYTRGRVS
jgi:FkbM family methyltransferase